MMDLNVNYSWFLGQIIAYFPQDFVGSFFVCFKLELFDFLPLEVFSSYYTDKKPNRARFMVICVFFYVVYCVLNGEGPFSCTPAFADKHNCLLKVSSKKFLDYLAKVRLPKKGRLENKEWLSFSLSNWSFRFCFLYRCMRSG